MTTNSLSLTSACTFIPTGRVATVPMFVGSPAKGSWQVN